MNDPPKLHLFDAVGVEIEYMIVDRATQSIQPIADRLFENILGQPGSDIEGDLVSWSNELVNHVVELKTSVPATTLDSVYPAFVDAIKVMQNELNAFNCQLMPTAMHPWMDPWRETVLWPGENNAIYATFDRIFNCKGHGWSNLQSMHLNLPFAGDEEFARLHAAIRLVLPIIPALAASSPFEQGRATGFVDNRMKHYLANTRRIPEVAGHIIPEPVRSEEEYNDRILLPIRKAVAPFDSDQVLEEEWVNARGAIARFARGSIEIRVIDSQECPPADFAVAELVIAAVRGLVEERWSDSLRQHRIPQPFLVSLLNQSITDPRGIRLEHEEYLRCWGCTNPLKPNDLWNHILADTLARDRKIPTERKAVLDQVVAGTLAETLVWQFTRPQDSRSLDGIARDLCQRLATNQVIPRGLCTDDG